MKVTGGSTDLHDPEFDVVKWFDAEDAKKALTYKNEEKILVQALKRIRGRK